MDLLDDLFPGSAHVHTLGLGSADDRVVFEHARNHGFCIVTKDSDFPDLALTQRQPPRILWLRVGNRSTARQHRRLHRPATDRRKLGTPTLAGT